MVLVPEARTNRQEVRNAIAAQFWGQPIGGVRSLDGASKLLPCEPSAPPQTAPSGLSRAQQLLAFQAVALPAMPAFNASHGGLVLDRALLRAGGRRWWTVLLGRARAQRMWALHRGGLRTADALRQPDNYGLASRSRFGLGRGTTLNTLVEVADLGAARARVAAGGGASLRRSAPLKAAAELKQDVLDHEIVLTAALNQEHMDSNAAYDSIPLVSTLDVKSKHRPDGLQYRAGLHYVYAPETELRVGGLVPVDAEEAAAFDGAAAAAGPWRAALHAQGAVAVEGEAVLWRPQPPRPRTSPTFPQADADGGNGEGQGYDPAPGQVSGSSSDGPVSGTLQLVGGSGEAGSSRQPGDSSGGSGGRARHWGGGQSRRRPWTSAHAAAKLNYQDDSFWEVDDEPLETMITSHGVITRRRANSEWATRPLLSRLPARESWRRYRAAAAAPDSGSEAGSDGEDPLPPPMSLPDADSLQSGMKRVTQSLQRVHEAAAAATREVRAGGLAERLGAGRGRRHHAPRRPYSPWLAQPYAKANGAVGCLARMPLPTLGGHHGPQAAQPQAAPPHNGGPHAGAPAGDSLTARIRNAWSPCLRETTLRIFASAGVSAQLGRFTRPLLDFTSASLRLDAGMTSQHVGGGGLCDSVSSAGGDGALRAHRAFALEGRNIWHAANVSVAQQLVGPVRARADLRFSLHVPGGYSPADGDRASLRSIWAATAGIRPAPLERIFGLDCVLPNTGGSGRACIWWSPARREALAELRLC